MLTEDLQLVLKVAEFRSITAAAASLDIRPATASAALKRVEAALGTELFVRTTRSLRLSAAGERFVPQCEQALQTLEQARQNIRAEQDQIDGELRIAVSSDLGRNLVMPWLDQLMESYPALRLRANISDSNIDFYRDSVDMALRYGKPEDSNLYGFKICNVPRLLCASPIYLAQHPAPVHPQDLAGHNGLFYQLHDILHDVWQFSHRGQEYRIKMKGNRASNDGDLVRRWCVAGKGVASKSALDTADDLLQGRLQRLLPDYEPTPTELWLIFPSRQSITPAARLVRDAVREKTRALLTQLAERGLVNPTCLD